MKPSSRRIIFTTTIAASILFICMISAAIILYPGGTYIDPNIKGYSWSYNFFSDLGRSKFYDGKTNTICRTLFSISLALIGAMFVPFFIALKSVFTSSNIARKMSTVGSIAGIIAGVAYVEVAVTPWDLLFVVHTTGVYIAFSAVVVMSICYSIAMLQTRSYSRVAAYVMVIFAGIAVAYLLLLIFGPSYKTPEGLLIQVVGQKIIVLTQLTALMTQAVFSSQRG